MDEIRKNQLISINFLQDEVIEGYIADYSFDRVLVKLKDEFLSKAEKLKELDEITATVKTHLGLKKMDSCIISELSNNCLLIENNPAHYVESKREFVRVKAEIDFNILYNNEKIICELEDISAGGIAFKTDKNLSKDDIIQIELKLEKENVLIETQAKIINTHEEKTSARFIDISEANQNSIMKFIFAEMTNK